MGKTLYVVLLTVAITATWIGRSAAQQSGNGQLLRVLTTTMRPDKRDQLPQVVTEWSASLAATKGIQWFKVGSDPTTGDIVAVTLWNSQADIDAFLKSEARKTFTEKIRPLMQGEPTIKQYQVSEAKK